MKKILAASITVLALSTVGCVAKMTGPGAADVTNLKQTSQECFFHVLGFGPFGNAILPQKADTIQYSFHNYVFFGKVCATGYDK